MRNFVDLTPNNLVTRVSDRLTCPIRSCPLSDCVYKIRTMIYFLCRTAKLCKEHPKICENLVRYNVISDLLDLLINSSSVRLQSTIINLLSVLFRSRANPAELKKFFRFFARRDHFTSQFVDGLLVIVDGRTEKIAPTFTLNFPQLSLPESCLQNEEEWVRSMHQLQNHYIPSPWTRCSLILSAFQDQACIWSTGFSASFWLNYNALSDHTMAKLAEKSAAENQLHIISFGTDTMLLELWVEETKFKFVVRLTAIRGNNLEIYSKFVVSAPVSSSQWHLMAFNISSEVKNDSVSLAVKLIIDGLHEDIFHTDFKKLAKNTEKLRVIIGERMDSRVNFKSSYCLGNVMMFQSDILTKAHCLTITSYGPDLETVLPSLMKSMKVNLTSDLAPPELDDSIFINVLQKHGEYVQHLQENLILSFTPRESQHFYRYTLHGESVQKHPSDAQIFDSQTIDQHFVYTIKTSVLYPIVRQHCHTFYDYILDNGGFSFVSFLLAKVVEMSDCKIVHANVLSLVLKIISSNCYLNSQVQMHRGYDLISYVMFSSRFVFSEHSLVALLEEACNEKLFRSDDIETIHFPRTVRIHKPLVITTLILRHWRRWQECNLSLLIAFFKQLCKFVHPQNNHQIFNAEVLTSHGIVEKVLSFCRKKFVESSETGNSDSDRKLMAAVLDFMQFLVCLLQSTDHFRQIADFLLIVHPSSAFNYQPSENGYFWSFEVPSVEKLQKRFQCQDKVNDIIAQLTITNDIKMDTCWSGEKPTLSVCNDEMDLLLCTFKECPTCKGVDNNECIHSLNCAGSNPKRFCQQCQDTFCNTILGHNSTRTCHPDDGFLAVGLLSVLHNAIMLLPESTLNTIRRDMVNGDLLATLINHPLSSVREAVLKIVAAYMSRSSNKRTGIFSKQKGFYILADQLTLHPVTEGIVNDCASLICQPSLISRSDLSPCLYASPPLVALLPQSVPHFPLVINILRYFKLLLKKNPHSLENLPENGLIDSLLKTIQITIHTNVCESCQEECKKALVAECIDLFTLIVNTCLMHSTLSTSKQLLHEVFYKWHWLTVIEAFEWRAEGEYLRTMNNLRRRVLQTALDKTLAMIKYHCSNNKASLFAEDLMNRFKFVIHRSLEFILFPPPQNEIFHFVCKLFVILIDAVSDTVTKSDSIYQQVNVFLRKQTVYLLLWVLSPSKPTYMRMFAVRKLHLEPNLKKILVTLFHGDAESEDKFAIFIWQLTFSNAHKLSNSEMFVCENFVRRLKDHRVLSASVLEKAEKHWFLEVRIRIRDMTVEFWERQRLYFDTLAAFVNNYSKDIQTVNEVKQKHGFVLSGNIIQRLGAQSRKSLYEANVINCIRVETKMCWMKIIEQSTHERTLWFVRVRPFNFWAHESETRSNEAGKLSSNEQNASKKFLIQKCLQHLDYEKPLSYLFDERNPNASVLSYIFMKDIISDSFNTIKIQYGAEIDGEVLMGEKDIYFVPARDIRHTDNNHFSIPFNSIDEVFYRTYKSKDNCVEMFLSNGKAEFFYFFSPEKRNEFVDILKSQISSKRIICCCILSVYTRKWQNGLITNWEYLHVLNKLAGRSHNDFKQCPRMPSILADYKSENISLAHPNIYRDLKRLSTVRADSKEFKTGSINANLIYGSENNDAAISEYFDVSEMMGYIYTKKKKNKVAIKNVKLPTWAHDNQRLFALVYRQLLESHHIRKNLNHWIDLAFGFKQATDSVKTQESSNNHVSNSCWMKNPLFTSPHPLPVDNQREKHCYCNLPVISGIRSIKWGNFVGSPWRDTPSVVSRKYFSLPIVAFVPLITNSVQVVFSKTAPIFFYDYETVLETGEKDRVKVSHTFLLHWNSNSGIISIRENQINRPIAFCPPRDPITVLSTTPDYRNIWVGLSSGTILVFKLLFNNSSILTNTQESPSVLLGHSNKINGIRLSRPFGIAVSISDDKSAMLWDLNKMTYIRSITEKEFPLNIVAISDTLGDIATVGYDESNFQSVLRMHTIDAVLVGSICSEECITAICFSTAIEGISVNVVATALENGVIRLWNTWDLSAVCEFSTNSPSPITCLTYSFDAESLYAATEDGYVTIWRSSQRTPSNCHQ